MPDKKKRILMCQNTVDHGRRPVTWGAAPARTIKGYNGDNDDNTAAAAAAASGSKPYTTAVDVGDTLSTVAKAPFCTACPAG